MIGCDLSREGFDPPAVLGTRAVGGVCMLVSWYPAVARAMRLQTGVIDFGLGVEFCATNKAGWPMPRLRVHPFIIIHPGRVCPKDGCHDLCPPRAGTSFHHQQLSSPNSPQGLGRLCICVHTPPASITAFKHCPARPSYGATTHDHPRIWPKLPSLGSYPCERRPVPALV